MVTAIAMVRDEADIVEHTVRRMVDQVDQVIVADNGSTDGTREILESLPVAVVDDPEVGYYQSRKMSALAARARSEGATWVVPFDADEVWIPRRGLTIAEVLSEVPEWVLVAEASLYDHVCTAQDPASANPLERIQWRRQDPGGLPKVACRALEGLTIHQGNHGASYSESDIPPTVSGLLNIRHFPYRSVPQFVSKARNGAAAYRATDLPPDAGAHWRGYGEILATRGQQGIEEIFKTWFWRENPDEPLRIEGEYQPELVFDPCP